MFESTLKLNKKRIRLAILSFYFMQGLCFASWASRIPDIKASLQMSEATLGTVLFALPIGQLIGMPFSELLISWFGSIKVLIFSTIVYALTLISLGFATNIFTLFFCLALFGIWGNFLNISVNTQGVYIEDYYQRPIMASFHGGWSIAGFTGALFGMLAINFYLIPKYHFMGIASLVILLVIFNFKFLFPDKPMQVRKGFSFGRIKNIDRSLFLLGFIGFCSMATEGAMFDWSGVYFKEIVHAPAKWITLGYTLFMIMMATGRFLADKCINKWGRKLILQVSGILITIGLLMSVIFPTMLFSSLGFMCVGLGVSSVVPIAYSVAGKVKGVAANTALVIVSSVSFIGFLLGPPLIGYIAHAFNLRYSYALISLAGITISLLVSHIKLFKNNRL